MLGLVEPIEVKCCVRECIEAVGIFQEVGSIPDSLFELISASKFV